jgi:hypothetical protein
MNPLTPQERQLAETAARLIATAEEVGLPDPPHRLGVSDSGFRLLARAHLELRDQVRALHDLVDLTASADPVGTALTKVGLTRRPGETKTGPRLVLTSAQIESLDAESLLDLYCRTMREAREAFVKHETYVVRGWDGMDGCWTNCTDEVGREEALRAWAARTDGGARCVSYAEIDYYRIFPGGSRMHWDGSQGREMHR